MKTTVVEIPYEEPVFYSVPESLPDTSFTSVIQQDTSPTVDKTLLLQLAYGLVSFILCLRFFLNIRAITKLRKSGEAVSFKNLPLLQSPKVRSTFSFMNKIFVNKTQFQNEGIADEILEHEAVHIKQKHSLDILFIEFVNCLIWFNPVVYLIKRNIKLNHEYLADEGALAKTQDPDAYQRLLLKYTGKQMILNPLLASHLSYGETKQRFKIMFKTTNKRVAALKQIAALALITGLFLAFGEERVIAQDQEAAFEQKVSLDVPPPPPPVKFKLTPKTQIRFEYANGNVVKGEYGKLQGRNKEIFESPEGKGEIFISKVTYLRIPENEMLFKYADANKYRVWIDGKEIDANELSTYKPKDFIDYYITPFGEHEKEFGKLSSKVEFWTRDYKHQQEAELPRGSWVTYNATMKPDSLKKPQIREIQQDIPKAKSPKKIVAIKPNNNKVRFINVDGEKVEKMYKDLTESEKARFDLPEAKGEIFLPPPPPAYISDEMMEEFKNHKEYGVWLDGKRVENSVLENYSAKDFHHYYKSRLLKNASHYGQYTFHLSLYSEVEWEKDGNSNGTWIKHRLTQIKDKVKSKDGQKEKPQIREIKLKSKAKKKSKSKKEESTGV